MWPIDSNRFFIYFFKLCDLVLIFGVVDMPVPSTMENLTDICDRDGTASSSAEGGDSSYRLFGRQSTVHQCMGGGLGMKSSSSYNSFVFRAICGFICLGGSDQSFS